MYDSMDIYLAMHHKIESVRSAFLYLEREGKGIYPIRMYLQHGFQGDKSYEHCSINSINLQIENLPVSVVLAHSFTGLPVHGPRYNQTMHLIRSSSSWIRGESSKGSQHLVLGLEVNLQRGLKLSSSSWVRGESPEGSQAFI